MFSMSSWKTTEDSPIFEIKSLIEFLSSLPVRRIVVKKTSWDKQLPTNAQEKLLKWFEELPNFAELKVPRKILGYLDQVNSSRNARLY